MGTFNGAVIEEFRANGGKVGGMFEGAALLLLTVNGGRPRTVPLGYLADGDRLLVFASNAGGPDDPRWYRDVRADPRVTVERGDGEAVESFEALAVAVEGEERDELYARQSALVPAYADYQRGTRRVIPVVALHRADAERAGALGDHLVKVHADLRRELATARERVAAYLAGRSARAPEPALLQQFRAHCLTTCASLGEHHGKEEGVFPRIERAYPGLAPVLERLRREHVAVAALKRDMVALLDGLTADATETGAAPGDGGAADPVVVGAELDRMVAELEAHFAYEEERIVPYLNAMSLTSH
ncbi:MULTISPECIES: nitroreductase/quinone reductase family protein [Actinomadura]|uniref:Nitroreductase/quinone reductase family protein n=1 Tax=Actinomadura yumaensis TaxID=111807 RepID=A0ABW2CQ00_9ACTN|nr:nitroreductase/quinone reductase family protein [Actinomadura sp. J1-007]MWK32822.1 nitroreductase family deazaflavin-dependent oxidoreductase [Actinomadura sp. J1-007]